MKSITGVITVLSARRYSFSDEKGREVDGVKIYYVEDWSPDTEVQNCKGIQLFEASLPISVWERMSTQPADYDAKFDLVRGPKGKPLLSVVDIQYVQDFKPIASALVSPNEKGGK